MTNTEKEKLRALISARKDRIIRRYRARVDAIVEMSTRTVGDLGDEAAREETLEETFAFEEKDLREIRRLEAAERRIDSEQFGVCRACGEEISAKRLSAVPETSLCIACAEEMGRPFSRALHSARAFDARLRA